jgi:hypothetical protein
MNQTPGAGQFDSEQGDAEYNPKVGAFLDLLEREIVSHPERLVPVTEEFVARLRELTRGVHVGPDEAIEGPVAL